MQAGLLSSEINESGAPTTFKGSEGNTAGGVMREPSVGPAESKNQGMHRTFVRENREIPWPPVALTRRQAARGRPRP